MTDDELRQRFQYGNGTLKNKLKIKDAAKLRMIEYRGVAERQIALLQRPPALKSFDDLMTINNFLFGWLYDWAGKLRNYNLAKNGFAFLEYQRFDNAICYVNDEITRLQNTQTVTIKEYASLLNDLNYIHPFREGNGRSTKLFLQLLALSHGQVIDYPTNNTAMIAGLNDSDVDKIAKTLRLQPAAIK